ncbi:nicotinate phosphoribosyltransferase [Limnochorda pilosa]|uniref:Nicotinate phosphoribosyltransferase n=1 Tax=Limnochorda pilosa TaxID=1555112 RepID=A0A0K2SJS9_LIMPI|nr:nicotinate phosphoribosyltransferase [Limnochorda pilosa]BAS27350.1 nicotinate phosphoribosyltransferase [Limnochorda pilosa]
MDELERLQDVTAWRPEPGRRFFSASHEEIAAGLTTDVYFIKTRETLRAEGVAEAHVVAEIFPREDGVFAGLPEVEALLRGRGVKLWALPEGSNFAAREVVARIEGPYDRFGLYETPILGFLASSSGWATAARRARLAAGGKPVFCFGARHVHPAVAPVMERAALVGGAQGAACILAAKLAGQEPVGTVPHALFLILGDTVQGARAYHRVMPPEEPRTILVDTYKDEAEESLRVAEALGDALAGVRLDTPGERGGVTPDLVRELRARLDQAGHRNVTVFVSGGLTPERLSALAEAGADAFGVGSYISSAAPIDMTMDLKEVAGKPRTKRGRIPGRTPNPRLVEVL